MTDVRPFWKWVVLAVTAAATLGATLCLRPFHQDPSYHEFADQRALLGIPHALNVLSNLPFLGVGVWGLCNIFLGPRPARFDAPWERWPWALFMAAVFLTGLGSSFYHCHPRNDALFWDRMPMTLGFSAFLGIAFIERADVRWGARLFLPIVLLGVASLLYGQATDLRFYFLLQCWAVLLVGLMVALFPSRYTGTREVVAALILYGVAKLFETWDAPIFRMGGIASGHTLKHLAAGIGAWRLCVMLRDRSPASAKSDDVPLRVGA